MWYLFAEQAGEDTELFGCADHGVLDAYRQMFANNGWFTLLGTETELRRYAPAAADFDAGLVSAISGLPE